MTDAKTCPQCGKIYGADDRFCTVDGAALVASAGASIIGTVIADRFLVQAKLGEGGMGEVYLAEHVRMKRKVALKLMRPWMLGDPVAVGRFHREAENASQISHPNVAAVYDFGETAERVVYLAMEYVDGEPLSRILQREARLNIVRTAEIVRQVAEALVAAHGMGILHRDLKPDNVMVARSKHGTDVVKLVDFGIARAMNRQTQQFTSTGLVVGTPDYMSPEQLSGDEMDGRSDLYALALMAYKMLTGGGAYSDSSSGESLVSRLTGKPKRLAAQLSGVPWPDSLQAAFDRALAPDPAQRHADPMEFVAELDAAVMQMPLGEEEQSYMVALSQRHPTPVRGGLALEGATPPSGLSAVQAKTPTAARVAVPTPTAATAVMAPIVADPPASPPPAPPAARGPVAPSRRSPLLPIVGGAGILAVAGWLWFQRDRPPAPAAPPAVASTAAPAPPVDSVAVAPAAPVASPAVTMDSVVGAARRATVAAWQSAGSRRGAAVLLDRDGLAVTAASLVGTDSTVDVFHDANTRIRVPVLSVDRSTGVATLQLNAKRCARCAPLSVAATSPAVGDSVILLPASGREDGERVVTTVASVTPALTLAILPRSASGSVVVALRSQQVVGLVDGTRIVAQGVLGEAVTRARGALSGRTPPGQVIPTWPSRAVPRSELSDAALKAVDANIAQYQVTQRDVTLLAMTPVVMQRRLDEATNPMNVNGALDPIGEWSSWKATVAERRAVVVLYASHAKATFLKWPPKPENLRNAEAATIRLFRGDSLVAPIEAARIPALTSNGKNAIPTAAIASYSGLDFREGAGWRVEVVDPQGKVLLNQPLPPGTLEAIRRDLAFLFR
ncbi:MAG: serine/threonine protein kinase [Gemmatimonadetes bacterium]|nr:serine/threonine protein kinase [Gemmatimonadota bacterium]